MSDDLRPIRLAGVEAAVEPRVRASLDMNVVISRCKFWMVVDWHHDD